MFEFTASKNRLYANKKEKLTTTSVGLEAKFTFSDEWDDLQKKAVFECNNEKYTVELGQLTTIKIPHEVFDEDNLGCELTLAVRGLETSGTGAQTVTVTRIPSVYCSLGIVEQGYDDDGAVTASTPTPSEYEQMETLVANCLIDAEEAVEDCNEYAEDARDSAADAQATANKLANMTVSATGLGTGENPTVDVSVVNQHYHFSFGIPKGETGHGLFQCDSDTTYAEVAEAVSLGKECYLIDTNGVVYILGYIKTSSSTAYFTGAANGKIYKRTLTTSGWGSSTNDTYLDTGNITTNINDTGAYNAPNASTVKTYVETLNASNYKDNGTIGSSRDLSALDIGTYTLAGVSHPDLPETALYGNLYQFANSYKTQMLIAGKSGLYPNVWVRRYITGISSFTDWVRIATQNDTEIFAVTYGTTTFAQVEAAIAAGKVPVMNYLNTLYYCSGLVRVALDRWYEFYSTSGNVYVAHRLHNTDTWDITSKTSQDSTYRTDDVATNTSSSTYYPSTKGVADYVTAKTPFVATYGTTAFADIAAAHNAGRICCLSYNGRDMTLQFINASTATFASVHANGTIYYAGVTSSNVWSNDSRFVTLWNEDTETTFSGSSNKVPRSSAVADYVAENIKVTYHIVYETEPSGYTNPTVEDVESWISDSSTVHLVRWKPSDSDYYFDLSYTYSNATYYYFCGASAQSRTIFARLRRSGSTAGSWSMSYITLQKASDTIFTSSDTFLVRYNSTDTTDRTSLADIEAAFSAGKNLILDFHVDIGSSGICDGVTGHFRYTDDLFYWYFVYATNGIRYVTLRRTGATAGAWGTGGTTLQNSNKLAQTITGNESSTELYPTTKAVADYVADRQQTFIATYGSTTWQQIYDAFTAGKQVVCIHNGRQYNLGYCSSGNTIYFNSITTSSEVYINVTTANVWSNGTIQLECSWNLNRKVPAGVNTYTVNCNTTEVYVPDTTCTSLTINISQNANSRATGELFIYTKNTVPTITFTHSSNLPIYWSTGSAPTFSLNHMYEISFKVIEGKVLCVFKDWGEV